MKSSVFVAFGSNAMLTYCFCIDYIDYCGLKNVGLARGFITITIE